jgi:tripartite-type tricarboxylate transporter receptor subunit TctC
LFTDVRSHKQDNEGVDAVPSAFRPPFTPFRRRLINQCGAFLALFAGLMAGPALADSWPARTVTMIVPFPAGGSADLLARAVAQELSDKLGKAFVIDNRGGAGGNIGAAAVAKANPDGYTILFTTPAPIALNKLMYRNMPYDPQADFEPVILIAKSPLIIAAKAGGFSDLKEMIDFAKANPGKINLGHPGNGTLGHITSELLQQMTGTKVTHVAYRGTTPLMTDLLGATVDVAIDFMPAYVPLIVDGKLKPLAVTSAARSNQLPNVPTAAEAGLPGFEASAWYAIVVPKSTPDEVQRGINGVVNAWLASDKGKAILEQNGMQGAGGAPGDLKAFIAGELDKWGPLIKAAKIEF